MAGLLRLVSRSSNRSNNHRTPQGRAFAAGAAQSRTSQRYADAHADSGPRSVTSNRCFPCKAALLAAADRGRVRVEAGAPAPLVGMLGGLDPMTAITMRPTKSRLRSHPLHLLFLLLELWISRHRPAGPRSFTRVRQLHSARRHAVSRWLLTLTPPQVTDNAIYILGDAQLVSPGPAGVNRLEIAPGERCCTG
jgi:hypothetical protein